MNKVYNVSYEVDIGTGEPKQEDAMIIAEDIYEAISKLKKFYKDNKINITNITLNSTKLIV